MSNFYTFLKGIMATLMLLVAPVAMAQGVALPQGLAGNYTYEVSGYTGSDKDMDISGYEKTFTGEMTVSESGQVLMTGFINTPVAYELVDGELSSVKKPYEGTYDAASQTVTFHQPDGSMVTNLADYSSWSAKDFTLKVQATANGKYVLTATDDITFMDTDGMGVSLKLQGVKMYQDGAKGEAVPAPAELAGKYQVSLGTPKFTAEGGDGGDGGDSGDSGIEPYDEDSDTPQWSTSYKAVVTVENGEVHMTGLIGTPVVADDDEFGFGTVPSYYVGAYDGDAQTLTFSLPEGAQIVDEAAGNIYSLANPFTLKLSQDENGKYVMSTTDPVVFNVAGVVNGTLSYAGATFNVAQSYTIAKEDVIGDWTLTGSMLDEDSGELAENSMTVTFGEEDGELYLTNLGGSDEKYAVTYSEDGLTIEPVMDYDTSTGITGDYTFMSMKPVTFTFTEKGGMVLESGLVCMQVKGESFAQIAIAANATLTKVVKKNDPVYTDAPADMAGLYTLVVSDYTASTDDGEKDFPTSFRGSVSITEDGKAEMKGLLGSFTHTEIDYDNETETTTESGFIGQYDSANSEITFSMPEGYSYDYESPTYSYYNVTSTQPFTVKVVKGEDGMYTLTAETAPVFQMKDVDGMTATYTVSANSLVATQRPTYSMTEDELMGKWQMKYTYYDEEDALNFEIKKNEAGNLVVTNVNGDDKEHAVTLTTGGFVVKGYSGYDMANRFSEWFTGAQNGTEDVEFEFTADKNLALVSVLKWSTADHKQASIAPVGTVATHPAKEHQPAPAPADMKGVYVMNVPTYTTVSGEEAFDHLGHAFRGSIVVDEDGKVQMQGLLGKFTKTVIDTEAQDEYEVDTTFVGQYDAAYETVTFSLPAGYRFGDTDKYYWFTLAGEFTMNVTKGEDGKYVFTAADPIVFNADDYDGQNPSCTVNLEGVTFVQQDTYEANMEDMLGNWQFNYEADGESKTVDFTIEELDGVYSITNFAGDEDNVYDITTTLGGFTVKGLYEWDGFSHLFSGSNGYSATDVVFAFTADKTFKLVTPLCFNTAANHTVTCIPEGTEAVRPAAKLGEAVASLEDLDPTKTYVLYNPTDKVYAVANPEQETNIWAANVPGEEAFNATAVDFDATSAYMSWQVVKKGDKIMIYNVGAKKYLDTAHATGNEGGASTFSSEVNPLIYVELGDGKFAFSATGNDYDYFCAAKQFTDTPMAVRSTSDHGSSWMFIENPNVEADADAAATMTGITTVSETPAAQGGIYSVSGVKLNVTDVRKLQKGMYIVNGKKVLVK